MTSVLITGANGHLGRRLIGALPEDYEIEALVRSERARRTLLRHTGAMRRLKVTIADPGDPAAVAEVASHCDKAVHLIGTIKESRDNQYPDAHERPAQALVEAAARSAIEHIVYISILGADAASQSRCLRSRAAVEEILLSATTPVTVIRVPMVLGEADRASLALAKRAAASRVFLFHAESLEQPIYAGDVIRSVQNALCFQAPANQVFELAGPESLSRRELVGRAAATLNREPSIHSLPLALGLGFAGLFELFRASPFVTRDMLRVIDHDHAIDPTAAAAALGLTLTPLDETLRLCVKNRLAQDTT
jgi:NADH dehydrogenase